MDTEVLVARMNTDVLKKQYSDEGQTDFEFQLLDMRRQKNRAEDELENASERWRSERRRLNAEIDRLETELASGKRPISEDLVKIQQEFDDKMQKSSAEWDNERKRLTTEISNLHRAIAEAIERSSNPLRATQSIRDQFETKLSEANVQRLEIESQFLRAQAGWDQEKKTLMQEVFKVRRMIPPDVLNIKEKFEKLRGRNETLEEIRIRELEGQLNEARATIVKYHDSSMRSAQELAASSKEVVTLKRTVTEMKEQATSVDVTQVRREYEEKIQELVKENLRLEQQFQRASQPQDSGVGQPVRTRSNSPSTANFDLAPINNEVERVQREIEGIEKVLDNPSTPASTINQKNDEKAALGAYLRGVLFCLGRRKGQ